MLAASGVRADVVADPFFLYEDARQGNVDLERALVI